MEEWKSTAIRIAARMPIIFQLLHCASFPAFASPIFEDCWLLLHAIIFVVFQDCFHLSIDQLKCDQSCNFFLFFLFPIFLMLPYKFVVIIANCCCFSLSYDTVKRTFLNTTQERRDIWHAFFIYNWFMLWNANLFVVKKCNISRKICLPFRSFFIYRFKTNACSWKSKWSDTPNSCRVDVIADNRAHKKILFLISRVSCRPTYSHIMSHEMYCCLLLLCINILVLFIEGVLYRNQSRKIIAHSIWIYIYTYTWV